MPRPLLIPQSPRDAFGFVVRKKMTVKKNVSNLDTFPLTHVSNLDTLLPS